MYKYTNNRPNAKLLFKNYMLSRCLSNCSDVKVMNIFYQWDLSHEQA